MSARVILGVSGASGAILGLECARLLARPDRAFAGDLLARHLPGAR